MKEMIFVVILSLGALGCQAETSSPVPDREFKNAATRDLVLAALNGDEASARQELARGADLNDPGKRNCPALCYAITRNNVKAVDIILRLGAKPTQKFEKFLWKSPLHLSVAFKVHSNIIVSLLKYGADPNQKDEDGSLMTTAALLNNHPAFMVLHQHGAKLDWGDGNESDLLVSSLLGDNIETFTFLLEHGYCNGFSHAASFLGVSSEAPNLVRNIDVLSANKAEPVDLNAEADNEKDLHLLTEMQDAVRKAADTCKNEPPDSRIERK